MFRISTLATAALLLASCSLFEPGRSNSVTVTLQPQRASVGDQFTLRIVNESDEPIWQSCGWEVERADDGRWQHYTGAGCEGTAIPVKIQPDASRSMRFDFGARHAGTYRVEIYLMDTEQHDLSKAVRTTNAVEVTE